MQFTAQRAETPRADHNTNPVPAPLRTWYISRPGSNWGVSWEPYQRLEEERAGEERQTRAAKTEPGAVPNQDVDITLTLETEIPITRSSDSPTATVLAQGKEN